MAIDLDKINKKVDELIENTSPNELRWWLFKNRFKNKLRKIMELWKY